MSIQQRWIAMLYSLATGTRKTRILLTPLGVMIFGAFTASFVILAVVVDNLFILSGFLPEGANIPISIPVIAAGMFITAWSALHFARVRGTPVPFNPPPKLVTNGPYRYVRNPMLTGVFLLLFGIGFALNSISMVFVFTPIYVFLNVWELKNIEEPELVERLGEEYTEYRNRTPMFVPRLNAKAKQSGKAL